MKKRKNAKKDFMKDCCNMNGNSCGGGFYFLGFLGSAIYYVQTSAGFWNGVLGILKAMVWPVFLVYKLLGM